MNDLLNMSIAVASEPEERAALLALIDLAEQTHGRGHAHAVRWAVNVRRQAKRERRLIEAHAVVARTSDYHGDIVRAVKDSLSLPNRSVLRIDVRHSFDRLTLNKVVTVETESGNDFNVYDVTLSVWYVLAMRDVVDQWEADAEERRKRAVLRGRRPRRGGQHDPS